MRLSKSSLFAAAAIGAFAAPSAVHAEMLTGYHFYTNAPDDYYVSSGLLHDARTTLGATITNPSSTAATYLIVDAGATLTLNLTGSSSFNGSFFGEGNVVKTGSGSLQYGGFLSYLDNYYMQNSTFSAFYRQRRDPVTGVLEYVGIIMEPPDNPGDIPTRMLDGYPTPYQLGNEPLAKILLSSPVYRNPTYEMQSYGGLSGSVTVNGGQLLVAGYLSHWREFPQAPLGLPWDEYAIMSGVNDAKMVGVSSVILTDQAELSFQNTPFNVTNTPIHWDGHPTARQGTPSAIDYLPLTLRLNFVHNLKTGNAIHDPDSGDITGYTNDQHNTVLYTGLDSSYRVLIHMDEGEVGSIGIIGGKGRVFKTGGGDLTVLNKSTFTGDVFLVGGDTILNPAAGASGTGHEIWSNVASVNLVGSDGARGAYMSPDLRDTRIPGAVFMFEYKVGYVPLVEDGNAAQLILRTDQTIHNLQTRFAEASAPTDGYDSVTSAVIRAKSDNPAEIYIAGTGIGTNIQVDDNVLTIVQDVDGIYKGSINKDWNADSDVNIPAAVGTIVKRGAATLALLPSSSKIASVIVEEGILVANVDGLGRSNVEINGGTLKIVQNSSGTLYASISGGQNVDLIFTSVAYIRNASEVDINVAGIEVGSAVVQRVQSDFHGNVVVMEGVTVQLEAQHPPGEHLVTDGVNDSFPNSNTFTLRT
ncbi:MAG: hypothetical protein LBV28_05270, partial [Puniceicoccales bacterium]|nr:hypothetical protein [Puniceicoccales bacterium]